MLIVGCEQSRLVPAPSMGQVNGEKLLNIRIAIGSFIFIVLIVGPPVVRPTNCASLTRMLSMESSLTSGLETRLARHSRHPGVAHRDSQA